MQTAQDLQQRTQHIELLADRMVASDSGRAARRAYTQILSELDVLEQLTARLAVGEDESVLDLTSPASCFETRPTSLRSCAMRRRCPALRMRPHRPRWKATARKCRLTLGRWRCPRASARTS